MPRGRAQNNMTANRSSVGDGVGDVCHMDLEACVNNVVMIVRVLSRARGISSRVVDVDMIVVCACYTHGCSEVGTNGFVNWPSRLPQEGLSSPQDGPKSAPRCP